MEKLIERYEELYEDMASARDPKKMIIFGDAEKWVFHMVAEKHPELAEQWLTMLEAGQWYNYLSRKEADEIAGKIINQDGSRGARWPYDAFKAMVESFGAKTSVEPFYNCYALWIQANAEYSDHHKSASEFVPKDHEPRYFYNMAVEKLRDVDRPRFIRKYYGL